MSASATATPSNPKAREDFLAACERALHERRLSRLLLAGPRGEAPDLQRVEARPVELRGAPHLSFVYHHRQRDLTRNLPLADAAQELRRLAGEVFANAHLHTPTEELQLALSRKGRFSLRTMRHAAAAAPTTAAATEPHNREKTRWLALDRPFLAALGVTDAQGRLVPAMARKWRQINRFVEVMDGALAASPLADRRALDVLDFGAGKGYLTFALHDHLRHTLGLEVRVTGVELREDLVRQGNDIVARLGLQGLRFERGDVMTLPPRPVDIMIALHACDTATDHAIHRGIAGGAAIVCCAPCCHKQLRPQLLQPHPLRPILQHGVHLGQEAEMVTDGLRALLLQACGYDAQVFEFVSLEHTAKNKMILAVKRAAPRADTAAQVLREVQQVKDFYGIREQCLETLLRAEALL